MPSAFWLEDPNGCAEDPPGYVPIASSERALAALAESIRLGRSPISLESPCGMGKTLLLRMLAARERRARRSVIFSPFLHLPPEDIARWLLHLMGKPTPGAGPRDDQLLGVIRDRGTRAMLLFIDEFQSTPLASVQRLADLSAAANDALVLVTGGRSGRELDALRSKLGPGAIVSLAASLPADEMHALYEALLARSPTLPHGVGQRTCVVERARGIPALLMPEILRFGRSELTRATIAEARAAGRLANAAQLEVEQSVEAPRHAGPLGEFVLPAPVSAFIGEREVANGIALLSTVAGRTDAPASDDFAREVPRVDRRPDLSPLCTVEGGISEPRVLVESLPRARPQEAAAPSAVIPASRAELELANEFALVSVVASATGAPALDASAHAAPRFDLRSRLSFLAAREARPALIGAALLALISWGSSAGVEGPAVRRIAPVASTVAQVRVRVNARPWAVIHVDGIEVGPTPLSHLRLTPGPHDFRAEFSDGRTLRRLVEISPERRSVSLP